MPSFIQRYLDPAARLGEILFGLIMALGFTGAVRLGHDEADNHALFIGILGCNLAWAIVDGVLPMNLQFWPGAVVMMLIAALTASLVCSPGRAAWFSGVLVTAVYLVFAITLYLLPPTAQ